MRRGRARLQGARELGVQRRDRDVHRRQPLLRHGRDQVQVSLHPAGLGHQRERMVGLAQYLDHAAGEAQVALYRLVAVSRRADGDQLRPVGLARQLPAQQLHRVALGDDLRFKIEAGRQVQVAVRRPRVAVDAAVLAAPVGVERLAEVDVRRVVRGDEAARFFPGHLGARQRRRLFVAALPAVVEALAQVALEPVGEAGALPRPLMADSGTRTSSVVLAVLRSTLFIRTVCRMLPSWEALPLGLQPPGSPEVEKCAQNRAMDTLMLSRLQFAANISFHILFPTINIALCWFPVYFRVRHSTHATPHRRSTGRRPTTCGPRCLP